MEVAELEKVKQVVKEKGVSEKTAEKFLINNERQVSQRERHLNKTYTRANLKEYLEMQGKTIKSKTTKKAMIEMVIEKEDLKYKPKPKKAPKIKKKNTQKTQVKSKYEIESSRDYGIKRNFNTKKEAVDFIKNQFSKNMGKHYSLNGLNSKGKYQNMEDYHYEFNGASGKWKTTKWITRKPSDLE